MICTLLLVVALTCLAHAEDVIVFGDSWGTEGATSFKNMMSSHNMTVKFHAIGGTTAEFWARTPNVLKNLVDKTPDAKYIWVTIGGNDAAPMLEEGLPVDEITSKVLGWCEIFYDPLFEAHPDIKVVQFGYDILFWDYVLDGCVLTANQIFKRCGKHSEANFTICANNLFYNLQHAVETLASKYEQLTSVNLLGSMQAAGNVPNATVGKPNSNYFSPNEFTGPTRFCLHANDKGFDAVFANLWDLYFAKQEELQTNKPVLK